MATVPPSSAAHGSWRAFDTEAQQLADALRAERLSVLIGAAGLGRNAMLAAGVLPLLRRRVGDHPRRPGTTHMVAPVRNRRRPVLGPESEVVFLFDQWRSSPVASLERLLDESHGMPAYPSVRTDAAAAAWPSRLWTLGRQYPGARILFVFDHFEQLLEAPKEDASTQRFVEGWVQALAAPDLNANFLVVLDEGAWPRLKHLGERVPGFDRVQAFELQSRSGGSERQTEKGSGPGTVDFQASLRAVLSEVATSARPKSPVPGDFQASVDKALSGVRRTARRDVAPPPAQAPSSSADEDLRIAEAIEAFKKTDAVRAAEAARQAEARRVADAEARRIAEAAAAAAEEARVAEELRRLEARRAAEAEAARKAEAQRMADAEARRIAEEAAAAEDRRIAEEAAAAEARRIAEEAAAADARRIAEEAAATEARRIAQELDRREAERTAQAEAAQMAESRRIAEARRVAEAAAVDEASRVAPLNDASPVMAPSDPGTPLLSALKWGIATVAVMVAAALLWPSQRHPTAVPSTGPTEAPTAMSSTQPPATAAPAPASAPPVIIPQARPQAAEPALFTVRTSATAAGDARIASELARAIGGGAIPVRAVPAAAGVDAIESLRTPRSLAIARYDALRAARRNASAPPLRVLAPLYAEEVVFIVRADSRLKFIHDLRGRRINIGPPREEGPQIVRGIYEKMFGTAMTAPSQLGEDEALAELVAFRSIDAMVLIDAQPAAWLASLNPRTARSLRLLRLDRNHPEDRRALQEYQASVVRTGPGKKGEGIPTLATMSYLVVSGQGDADARQLTDMVLALCRDLPRLRAGGHPKWRELRPSVNQDTGWPVLASAQSALQKCASDRPAPAPKPTLRRTPKSGTRR